MRRFDGTGMRDPGREVGLSGAGGGLGAGPTPSTHAVRREQAEAVLAAMSRLPAEYSDAIRRRAWDGATFADIGAATGRTEDAVRAGTQAAGARTRSGRRRYLGLNGGAAAEAPQGA